MHPITSLGLDKESNLVDNIEYREMIESLLYLTKSRPNIMHNVYLCAQFQLDPRKVHLFVVQRIFRYLKGTSNLDLC